MHLLDDDGRRDQRVRPAQERKIVEGDDEPRRLDHRVVALLGHGAVSAPPVHREHDFDHSRLGDGDVELRRFHDQGVARAQRACEGDRAGPALLLVDREPHAQRKVDDGHAGVARQQQSQQRGDHAALVVDGADPPDLVALDARLAVPLPGGLDRVDVRDQREPGLEGAADDEVVAAAGDGVPPRRQSELGDRDPPGSRRRPPPRRRARGSRPGAPARRAPTRARSRARSRRARAEVRPPRTARPALPAAPPCQPPAGSSMWYPLTIVS